MSGTETWLRQTVTIAPKTGTGATGRDTYGTAVTTPCRIEFQEKMVQSADGQLKASTVSVYMAADAVVAIDSKLTMPDGSTPVIVAINTVYGPNGQPYMKVVQV